MICERRVAFVTYTTQVTVALGDQATFICAQRILVHIQSVATRTGATIVPTETTARDQ